MCPSCGWPLGEQSFRGRLTGKLKCTNPDCAYVEDAAASDAPAAKPTDGA
jgi:hypothetical protein